LVESVIKRFALRAPLAVPSKDLKTSKISLQAITAFAALPQVTLPLSLNLLEKFQIKSKAEASGISFALGKNQVAHAVPTLWYITKYI